MQAREIKTKRQFTLKLDPNEDLLDSIEKFIKEHGVRSGFFQFIGGVDKITYGVYNIAKKEYEIAERSGFHELLGLGNIAVKSDGAIFVHCHFFTNNKNCEPCGGHLVKGTRIFPFAEIFIQETDAEIGRAYDKNINLWPIILKCT